MRLHAKFGGDTAPAKAPPTPAPATRMAAMDASVSPAARNLALAHYVARLIDQGLLADFTAAARALGVSQVRMTHLMSLLLLAPQVQEAILAGTISPGDKQLRELARVADWSEQIDRLTRTNQSRRTHRPVTEAASPTTAHA